ncbi:MAG: hypothetical protein UZ22_OP11002000631 [Microgenomates bacterium OLB23]|nr:MAG: hypothetical protein UZ22_OP11002000631 [Microgenomates bacterium OLB23]
MKLIRQSAATVLVHVLAAKIASAKWAIVCVKKPARHVAQVVRAYVT